MHRARTTLAALVLGLGLALALSVLPGAAAAEEHPRPNLAALQSALEAKGLYEGEVDGIFGPLTRRAIALFERRRGLKVDGVADRSLRRALGWRGRPALGRRPMRRGDRGWDVAGLQYLLQRAGYGAGRVDALFGPLTRQAVGRAQRDADELAVDGVAGRGTLSHLVQADVAEEPPTVLVDRPSSGRFIWPVDGPVGDRFGAARGGSRVHQGIDFPVPMRTPIVAAAGGTVIYAGWNSGGYGNLIVIQHDGGYTSWYAHLSSIQVRTGSTVTAGHTIGRVGSTGYSTGPHLHFEIRYYDSPVNPLPLISGRSNETLFSFASSSAARGSGAQAQRSRPGWRHDHSGATRHECGPGGVHGRHGRSRHSPPRGGDWIARERLC